MKYIRLIGLLLIVFVVQALLLGCSEIASSDRSSISNASDFINKSDRETQEPINKSTHRSSSSQFQVTDKDIKEAKNTVEKHFESMSSGDIEGFEKTLGEYKSGYTDQANIKDEFKKPIKHIIKSISYPGHHLTENKIPERYTNNFQKEPYKILILNVNFEKASDSTNTFDWDYILLKETKNDPWLIHDWGN